MPGGHVSRSAVPILSAYGMKCQVLRKGLWAYLRVSEEGPEDLVRCQQKAGILRQQVKDHHLPTFALHPASSCWPFQGEAGQRTKMAGLPAHLETQVGPLIVDTQLSLSPRLDEGGSHLHMCLASVVHSLAAVPA